MRLLWARFALGTDRPKFCKRVYSRPCLEPMVHNVNFEKSFSRVNFQKLQMNGSKHGVGMPPPGSSKDFCPLSIYLYQYAPIHLPIYLSIYPSMNLSIYPSIYLDLTSSKRWRETRGRRTGCCTAWGQHEYSGSMKIITPLDHISHCKTAAGTNWSNRWTYHKYSPRLGCCAAWGQRSRCRLATWPCSRIYFLIGFRKSTLPQYRQLIVYHY